MKIRRHLQDNLYIYFLLLMNDRPGAILRAARSHIPQSKGAIQIGVTFILGQHLQFDASRQKFWTSECLIQQNF